MDTISNHEEDTKMSTPTRKPCDREPDLWFSADPEDQYEAAQACSFCPFAIACEKFGADEIHGVWGGRLRGYTKTRRQPKPKPCAYAECAREFVTATASAKYCSDECRDAASNARRRAAYEAQLVCGFEPCNKRFTPKTKRQRFCSEQCGLLNKRKNAREADRQRKRMERGHPRLDELVQAAS